MALTYRALALLLTYPTADIQTAAPAIMAAIRSEGLVPPPIVSALDKLARKLEHEDLYELQEGFVHLFDRTRSLSLNLYEHIHGESRDRGQAMAALIELYGSYGLELTANELPDHLPVFLDFLSTLPDEDAASLLGEGAHVLAALAERLHKRESPYRAVFGALAAMTGAVPDSDAVAALMQEPDDDPDDLETLDKAWEETAVTFGPAEAGCPKADAILSAMNAAPSPDNSRRADAAA
ncbi:MULTISPECIES: nitrate reductase molybdenum cofactor assembly chaperone [Brevundimonas]|jgi:nitrate reductase molybdenum cofactor assembly chaperone NarJ/NarW|uniref:Nitrate reductase molybdenum cofactor assembly chaperone n=1 Tax=Brevundimonas mediterranea TaxID=74329 RepID=A0A6G7EKV4_9CAUL|nr:MULTISPECIES: nitrate reductase molybdenum cofactor assembly chaperone [Brevundimonas]OGN47558.1 MAG: nitrate reductase molybdenum cofactor assembly chaperone [Caulobacterales bacterium RIFCSPHIGHO2_12_FULL_68_13]OGN50502.1 MAG: nitrate reductase molybdenum cofactor assembly chaperone [Caulobacterales bacterium RIFCSPHIGHO2_01_FULL_67_30]OYX81618.1 MAG: nitrate reductase molybdenum cofactor assembly chaperone [Brevundimonas sp. 32-68-21]PZO06629.1 MAG: nitrate reductase molybdenum cofactor a